MVSLSSLVAPGVGPVLFAVLAAAGAGVGAAQDRPQSPSRSLAFEVASVKPSGPPVPGVPIGPRKDPGRFTYSNARLNDLLMLAYNVQLDQISGPDWIASADYTYTVAVTMDPKTTEEEFRVMLQNLLAERFQVRLHHETRNRPGYELAIANGGLKLKEWTPPKEEDASPESKRTGVLSMRIPRPGQPVVAHLRMSMEELCAYLPWAIRLATRESTADYSARVIDQTGLKGIYDLTIEFATANPSAASPLPQSDRDAGIAGASAPQGVADLFTVLEEKLGLKLRKAKAVPVAVLVVDDASKVPTGN